MDTYTRAAFVAGPRNMHGSVVCKAADALPFLLQVGQEAHFVPPTLSGPRHGRVNSVKEICPGQWEVAFDGVGNRSAAEALAGSFCLVEDGQLPEDAYPSDSPARLVGYQLDDAAAGPIGEVTDVLEGAYQATLRIDGAYGQVLVPYVDEYVKDVDDASLVVHASVPDALLSLNAPDSERMTAAEDAAAGYGKAPESLEYPADGDSSTPSEVTGGEREGAGA